MSQLTLGNVLPALARHISTTFALQIADPQHPDYGGIVYPEWGLAALLAQVSLAAEYLLRVQRLSGLNARVLMTFVTPIDYRFSIRVWHRLAP